MATHIKSEIQWLMEDITDLDEIQVYSVSLMKSDHSEKWTAYAILRADSRNVSMEHDEPEQALLELKNLIRSLVCPHCHRVMDKAIET